MRINHPAADERGSTRIQSKDFIRVHRRLKAFSNTFLSEQKPVGAWYEFTLLISPLERSADTLRQRYRYGAARFHAGLNETGRMRYRALGIGESPEVRPHDDTAPARGRRIHA